MYAIVGASGNTGSVIAAKLLASGRKVRAIGRDASRLERLTSQGAEGFTASRVYLVSCPDCDRDIELADGAADREAVICRFGLYLEHATSRIERAASSWHGPNPPWLGRGIAKMLPTWPAR